MKVQFESLVDYQHKCVEAAKGVANPQHGHYKWISDDWASGNWFEDGRGEHGRGNYNEHQENLNFLDFSLNALIRSQGQ